MISDFDLARKLFPRPADVVREATAGTPKTSQIRGTAMSDSADGMVSVVLDASTGGENAVMEVPTSGGITEGSEVLVTLLNGSPVDCTQAGSIDTAKTMASAAQAVANAINQHFWHDDNGAHVTMATQDEWEQEHSGPNSLWNALGMLFRDGLNNMLALLASSVATEYFTVGDYDEYQTYYPTGQVQTILSVKAGGVEVPKYVDGTSSDSAYYTDNGTYISLSLEAETQYAGETMEITYLTPSAMAFFDGLGNDASNAIASFSSLGATIGYEDSGHTVVDARGMHVYTGASSTPSMEVDADGMSVSGANGTMYFNLNNTYEVPRIVCAAGVQMMNGFYQQMGTFYPVAGFLVDPAGYDGATIAGSSLKLLHFDPDTLAVNQATVPMEEAIVALRHPVVSFTGTNTTNTATANGWRLTYFNTRLATVGDPIANDFTFSNGVITPLRDICVEISGVMHWRDTVGGMRGFGIFSSATPGSGTEYSVFQNWSASSSAEHKSVVFPARTFNMPAGSQWSIGRYEPTGAIYTNGTNMSWITIKVVG